ncbi:MAG: NAD(P)/FAD-dependent oxidoreductase, partial [Ilumatobacteraceae bacterium]
GGPAGMTAALQARELGAVALVDVGQLGGTMLDGGPGPIPTAAVEQGLARGADEIEVVMDVGAS